MADDANNLKSRPELLEYVRGRTRQRQGKLRLDWASLLVMDMQNYFLDKSSHAYIPSAPGIIPGIISLIGMFCKAHRPVIFTRHLNTAANAGMMNKWWADTIRESSPLSKISDKFDITQGTVVRKSQYDAFYNTTLDVILKQHYVKQVVVTGVMTNLCCETTARAAFVRGYEVFFPVDGTATYNSECHEATLLNLAYGFAHIVSLDELLSVK
jgi:bifunctional isochorismate lyase/aryl carrier protein